MGEIATIKSLTQRELEQTMIASGGLLLGKRLCLASSLESEALSQ